MRFGKRYEPYRFQALADYNAEVYRGIVHTPEYDALMADEQRLFNSGQVSDGVSPIAVPQEMTQSTRENGGDGEDRTHA